MFNKANPARDAFTFSLGGMAAKTSFVIAPAIADDRINQAWDKRFRSGKGTSGTQRAASQPRFRWAT